MGLLDDIHGRKGALVAACQPYFVSDGSPVNTFEFLRPFLRSLEYDLPKSTIYVPLALFLGKIFQGVYTVLYPWLSRSWLPQPLILPAEVYKVGVTHYFSYLKSKERAWICSIHELPGRCGCNYLRLAGEESEIIRRSNHAYSLG
ncbi:hypothetical protein V5N11_010579 [Cardamine amara subsp. amara]|uniref:Uncharacterized protein n=1 Tax=Cardamine amara subsp. amara TaxID=228776 RepID=A0ABD1B6X2_CARAN